MVAVMVVVVSCRVLWCPVVSRDVMLRHALERHVNQVKSSQVGALCSTVCTTSTCFHTVLLPMLAGALSV